MPIAVADQRIPAEAIVCLKQFGMETLLLPAHSALPPPVASHPDLLLFFEPNAIRTTKRYLDLAKQELTEISRRTGLPIQTITEELFNTYPQDILLDAAPVGSHLFCLEAHTAKEICTQSNRQIISVRQGYAKCSVIPISNNALITSDPSIASAATRRQLDVLLVSADTVRLPGYANGFIGGAASFAPFGDMEQIFFCGDLSTHPQSSQITDFCTRHQKQPISLGSFPLTDVGTIFILNENQ